VCLARPTELIERGRFRELLFKIPLEPRMRINTIGTSHGDNVTRVKSCEDPSGKVKTPPGGFSLRAKGGVHEEACGHDGRGVCHRCHNRCIRCFRPVVGPPRRQCALLERRCRAGEMVLQSQTRTSRRVEQLPLNGAVQTAGRHARKVGLSLPCLPLRVRLLS